MRPRRENGARGGLALSHRLCFLSQELDGNIAGGGGGEKRWLHSMDHYRRLKDEDPIIPFSEAPIISKWGAISRAARAGYHTADPIQAAACQGTAAAINLKGASRTFDPAKRERLAEPLCCFIRFQPSPGPQVALQRLRLLQPLQFPGEVRAAVAVTTASLGHAPEAPCCSVLSEHLCASQRRRTSLSSGEITAAQQMSYSQDGGRADGEPDPGGDIELELCALDLEDSEMGAQVVDGGNPR